MAYYYLTPNYRISELKAIERKAVDAMGVLRDKVVSSEQLYDVRDWLEHLSEQLAAENPRCEKVEVDVDEMEVMGMGWRKVSIRFGNLIYSGLECSFLTKEDLAF